MRAYSNLKYIHLSSCGSLQQYIIHFNNAFEELTHTGASLPYGLILFWFIEFIDDDEYHFWKESFKTKIHELSDENLEEGNWIRQAQQELLDCNINPTVEGKNSSTKCPQDESIGEINLTDKGSTRKNSNWNKQSKSTHSDTSSGLSKSQQGSTGTKPVSKCKVCDGNHATENCFYTSKNPPSKWHGKPEIWQRIIETCSKQD